MNISGNTIFIPGGTSGIGLGLALRLQAAGNTVVIAGRRTELLESITREHPGLHSIALDTTDADAVVAVSARRADRRLRESATRDDGGGIRRARRDS